MGAGIGICQAAIARRDEAIVPVLPKQFSLPLETWITMHEDPAQQSTLQGHLRRTGQRSAAACRLRPIDVVPRRDLSAVLA
jgi:hypothetical protein